MNFQTNDTATGLSTTGMKISVRSTYRVFSVRFSASANSRPKMLVKTRNPIARNSVFSSEPSSSGVWKILMKLATPTKSNDPIPDQFVNAKNAPDAVVM